MASSEQVHVEVAVALVTDASKRVLLTFNDRWGSFTLPMTRRRRGTQANEPTIRAARRAAAEALGVPVRLAEPVQKRLPVLLESGRQLVDKIYSYRIFHIEPHPDFAGALHIRQPHAWLSPHWILSGAYEPISESARFILNNVIDDFEIPARVQHTSVVVTHRESAERGRQFLVRWNPAWGYALPAKRWQPAGAAGPEASEAVAQSAAERVVREELGLKTATDMVVTPLSPAQLKTRTVSLNKDAPAYRAATDYIHSLFDGALETSAKLRSKRPLVWVTEEEIHGQQTTGSQPASDEPAARAGPISRTVYEILLALGMIGEFEEAPEVLEEMRAWSRTIEARMKAASQGTEP